MKKSLLLGASLAFMVAAYGQNNHNASVKTPLSKKNEPLVKLAAKTGNETAKSAKPANKNQGAKKALPSTHTAVGETIGETVYDLETNAAMARRIQLHADGTISAIWTISANSGPNYADRGTGYNYFDGSKWLYPDTINHTVISRLETIRTGFPDLGLLGTSTGGWKDVVVSHNTSNYTLMEGTNTTKGIVPFNAFFSTGSTVPLGSASQGSIWPRLGVGGAGDSTMHVISNYGDSTIIINGVKQPFVYSRSQDGGVTWDITGMTLP
ncbi:MAG: hypothetical protein IAF38_07665, partial [Bacteroidia bacterium]|nr:hypothetical protein [Bacteroidia bacterium]